MRSAPRTARIGVLAAVVVGYLVGAADNGYAATTITLPPLDPATGYTCSATVAFVGFAVWEIPLPIVQNPPVPVSEYDNLERLQDPSTALSSPGSLLGPECGDPSTGSHATGVMATASTSYDDAGQVAMTNIANVPESGTLAGAFTEVAYTDGSNRQTGSVDVSLGSDTETMSVTYSYEVLARSFANTTEPADLAIWAGPASGSRCQDGRIPQQTTSGDTSVTIGSHTVTADYTCPSGDPLQVSAVVFGIDESQEIIDREGAASSYVSARWDGGTVTSGP